MDINDVAALHFKGVVNSLPSSLSDYKNGDVVIVDEKEYVLYEGVWHELGDVTDVESSLADLRNNLTSTTARVNAIENAPYATQTFVSDSVASLKSDIDNKNFATEAYVDSAVDSLD